MKNAHLVLAFALAMSSAPGWSKDTTDIIRKDVCEMVQGIQTLAGGCIFQKESGSEQMVHAVDTHGSCTIYALPQKDTLITEKGSCNGLLMKIGILRNAFFNDSN